ncbi:MAG: ABC transporter permease [Polyangiaceae bacterium]
MSSALSALFSETMLAQTIRASLPYTYAALGGILSERSGIAHVGLEGILLGGAFAAVATHVATGSPWLGLLCGGIIGASMGFVHGYVSAVRGVHAILSGLVLNLLALGVTRFLLRAWYASSANSPAVPAFRYGERASALVRTIAEPPLLLVLALGAFAAWLIAKTRFGLRIRASGENPTAAKGVGVPVARTQVMAVTLGSAIAGLGGVALAFDQHQFQAQMSGGRGFIALAAIILARHRVVPAVIACTVFAVLESMQVVLQGTVHLPSEVFTALPYVATLVALGLAGTRFQRGAAAS